MLLLNYLNNKALRIYDLSISNTGEHLKDEVSYNLSLLSMEDDNIFIINIMMIIIFNIKKVDICLPNEGRSQSIHPSNWLETGLVYAESIFGNRKKRYKIFNIQYLLF